MILLVDYNIMYNEVNLLKDKYDVSSNMMQPTISWTAKIIIISIVLLFGLCLMLSMESEDERTKKLYGHS